MDYGKLIIRPPYGAAREHRVGRPAVTFGQAADNDVVLDDPSVSARHARLVIEDGELSIEDLGSTQNTVVNDAPITPNVRYRLSGQERIRLGDVEVKYVAPAAAPRPVVAAPEGPPLELTFVDPPRTADPGRFPVYSVEPGEAVTIGLSAQSRLPHPAEVTLSVDGIPPGWLQPEPTATRLAEFGWADLQATIALPRSPEARAGLHPIVLRIATEEWVGERHEAQASGLLSVDGYGRVRLSITPAQSEERFGVQVDNNGNLGVIVDLLAEAYGDPAVACSPRPAALSLAAGETGVAHLVVSGGARSLLSAPAPRSITVSAVPRAAAAESQAGTVDYLANALVPVWLLVLVVAILVAAVGLVAVTL